MTKGVLHHIEINVSNINEAREFYGWLLYDLGYRLFQEWEQGFSWTFEKTYLVFVQTEERFLEEGYHRKHTGLNHLAFYVESKEEVDDWTERIKAKGYTILYEEKHPYAGGIDHYAVFFEGPDRIKLELVAGDNEN
jgi:catechol 2,3-dioxygenase-like lactoylglutathione lyase family enzyme